MAEPKSFYPCDKEDCTARIKYFMKFFRRGEGVVLSPYPDKLFPCLFCAHFNRIDMYFKGEAIHGS